MNYIFPLFFSWFFLVIIFTNEYYRKNYKFEHSSHFVNTRRHLEFLCKKERLVGGEFEKKTLDYLVNELRHIIDNEKDNIHYEVDLSIEDVSGENFYKPRAGIVRYSGLKNVVLYVRPNTDEKNLLGSVMISSHYDSAVNSIGCFDDGIPVSIMLDVVKSVLRGNIFSRDNPLKHELIFFFNTGEETWLLGSSDFSKKYHETRKTNPIIFFNLEAGGVGGRDILMRTNDYFAIKEFSKVTTNIETSVIFKDIYQLRLNDGSLPVTDFNSYHFFGGFKGFETGFFENQQMYHTPQDRIEFVEDSSIFHMGEKAINFIKHFGSLDHDFPIHEKNEEDAYDVNHEDFPFSFVIFDRLIVLRFTSIRLIWVFISSIYFVNYFSSNNRNNQKLAKDKIILLTFILLVLVLLFIITFLFTLFSSLILHAITPMFFYSTPLLHCVLVYFILTFLGFLTGISILPTLSSEEYSFGLGTIYTIMIIVMFFRNLSSGILPFVHLVCMNISQIFMIDLVKIVEHRSNNNLSLKNRSWWMLANILLVGSLLPFYMVFKEIFILSNIFFAMGEKNLTEYFTIFSTILISFLFFFSYLPILPFINAFKKKDSKNSEVVVKKSTLFVCSFLAIFSLSLFVYMCVPDTYSSKKPKGIFLQQVLTDDEEYILFQGKGFIDPLKYMIEGYDGDLVNEYDLNSRKDMILTFSHSVPRSGKKIYIKHIDYEKQVKDLHIKHTQEDMIFKDSNFVNHTFFVEGNREIFFQIVDIDCSIVDWSLKDKVWDFLNEKRGRIQLDFKFTAGRKKRILVFGLLLKIIFRRIAWSLSRVYIEIKVYGVEISENW